MGCLPASYRVAIEKLFCRIRCISACCGGSIVVQNSEFCDEKLLEEVYYDPSQPGSFGGVESIYRAAVERGRKIPRRKIQD